jgi:glycosyltransferase involved in cell wall biosynthesis
MKILLVHNYYRKGLVGGEDLVFSREVRDLKSKLGTDNVIEYYTTTDKANGLSILFNVFFSIIHFIKVYRLIRKNRINLVHCHNFFPLLSLSVFVSAKFAGAATVISLHNYRFWCIKGTLFRDNQICLTCIHDDFNYQSVKARCFTNSKANSLVSAIAFWFYKKWNALSYIDYFFVLTTFQQKFLIANGLLPEHKIILKPNYIDISGLPAMVGVEKKFDLIFVGRLEQSKGSEYLMAILEAFPELRIAIVGASPDYMENSVKSTEKHIFFGTLSNDETLSHIADSKFLIQLSVWFETFGLTIIEAMALGVPVLGFPIGTRPDFIKDGYNGFFLSQHKIGESIKKAMNATADEYALLSANCIEFAGSYAKDKVIEQQVKLYQQILNKATIQ